MANRIVQNVIIVDSAMGNALVVDATSGNFKNWHINAIAIFAADTTCAMKVTGTNTQDTLAYLDRNINLVHFSSPQRFADIKVPVLTATTGWFYLA